MFTNNHVLFCQPRVTPCFVYKVIGDLPFRIGLIYTSDLAQVVVQRISNVECTSQCLTNNIVLCT